ncbi:MAG TPA: UdgX family uracil-DNA binding protein [Vicinamibacterales bacterium]|jgi:DNA polymerase|nr:UdgX family uracil-DNA binding protein [Vicinamibacterales bacterium]
MPVRRSISDVSPRQRLSADSYVPDSDDLNVLARAARRCHGCPLFARATQTVFGEGPVDADIMLVGEQPGDAEDIAGRPFVGPAGRLLDRALADAGLSRDRAFVTNAVKHFKWEPRGRRRIHKRPSTAETSACRAWLDAEIRAVHPRVIVLLGATAAQSLVSPGFRLMQHRGDTLTLASGTPAVATRHPSSVLRAPGDDERRRAYEELVSDLKRARVLIERRPGRRVSRLRAAGTRVGTRR